MRRLQSSQSHHSARPLPSSTYIRLYYYITRLYNLFQDRFSESLPPDPSRANFYPKNCYHYPFGLFEFVCMPFSLRNAAQTFQRLIDEVLCDLHFSYTYIDDVLIASSNPQEHKQHLKQVFDCFKQFGVIVNPTKCQFGASELTFVGHSLNSQGIRPLQDKVKSFHNLPHDASCVSS